MGVRIHFLGCGDAFASGGRFQTTFLVEVPGAGPGVERFLIDCGATALIALKRAGLATGDVPLVLVTHLHGDHFGGLPFLLLEAEHIAKRRAPLTVAGPPGLGARLAAVREAFYPGGGELPFPLELIDLAAGVASAVGGVTVTPFPAVHPSGAPAFMLRLEVAGRVLAFTGDTGWTEELFRMADGADLLIAECSTWDRPLANHLDYRTLAARRAELRCRRLILTHLGADVLAREEAGGLGLETARDGLVVEI